MAPLVDILTLDNFASKLPPWSPELPNHLYALVDMGSNGIRFSISDLSPPRSRLLRCLYRERAAISLFDALSKSSSSGSSAFPPDVIVQVSQALARFNLIAREYGVPPEHVSVFATEAMRKASNAVTMLDAIKAESGLTVHVLAPEAETLFGAMGARSGFSHVNGLFLDLGGGSVQMTYMNSNTSDYAIPAARTGESLPFGAARLIDDLENSEVEARDAALAELRLRMRRAFSRLEQEYASLKATQHESSGTGTDIYLCGGGFRGYGNILMHSDPVQPYPIPSVSSYTVRGTFFKQTDTMRKLNSAYQGKIFGMSKRRRRQFPAIVAVVEALIGAIPRIRTVTFCGGGNREGVLLLKLPPSIREACPLPLLPCSQDIRPAALKTITDALESAFPPDALQSNIPTVFSLGLGPLFASEIWARMGEPGETNASFQLHRSLTRDSSAPGLTHLARAVLGLTLCFRWGATLGPVDHQLFNGLQSLVSNVSPEALFWARYIGEVAHLLSKLCPLAPTDQSQVERNVEFEGKFVTGKNKTKLQLSISLNSFLYKMLDHQEIANSFQDVGKRHGEGQNPCDKVVVLVQMRS